MAGIRDDSAGSYGQWLTPDDWSWLDHVKAGAYDTGNALANLGSNLAGALTPINPQYNPNTPSIQDIYGIGEPEQGPSSFQIPPMISGIADSYSRLAGTPSQPGNAYDLTGVKELDAPVQQDMSNVLLSLYGGNAMAGLTKPKGALGAGLSREALPPENALANHRLEGSQTPMQPQAFHQGGDLSGRMPDLSQGQQAPAPRSLIENDPYLKAWEEIPGSVDAGTGWAASHMTTLSGMLDIAGRKRLGDVFNLADGVPVVNVVRPWKDGAKEYIERHSALKSSDTVPSGWHMTDSGPVYVPSRMIGDGHEMLDAIGKSFDDFIRPKIDYFYRGTNNNGELGLVENGSIKRSKNHATGEVEDGLSVSSGPETLWAYDYPLGYKVKGNRIAFGSDGEPVLDVNSLTPVSGMMKSSDLMNEWDRMRTEVASQHGIKSGPVLSSSNDVNYLFSDTGQPSLLGSALATAGEQPFDLNELLTRYGAY